jgi:hypothetical protein
VKVFISWSGETSKGFGQAFRTWLPRVLQSAKPYFTPADTEKGARWANEISKELEQSDICIIILTRENLNSRWIMFEAGAISRTVEQARVCPIVFDIDKTDVEPPLSTFQATSFNKGEIRQLLTTINKAAKDASLSEKDLDAVFEKWWPDLAQEVSAIAAKQPSSRAQIRSEQDLVEENLLLTRGLVIEQQKLIMGLGQLTERLAPSPIGNYVTALPTGNFVTGVEAPWVTSGFGATSLSGDIGRGSAAAYPRQDAPRPEGILGKLMRETQKGSKKKPSGKPR